MTILSDQQWLALAAQHTAAGRLADAEAIYWQLLTTHPGNPDLMHELGLMALRAGRIAEARQWIEQAIATAPADAIYRNNLGLILHDLGECEPAIASFEQALQLDPNFVNVFFNAGNTRLKQERFDDAAVCFQRFLAHQPDDERTYVLLGAALSGLGDHAGVVAVYQEAVRRLPGSAPLWNHLGNALNLQAQVEAAALAYRKAIECAPDIAQPWNNLGQTLWEAGLLDEALDCTRRSVALDPSLAGVHSNIIFMLQMAPGVGRETIAGECQRWWCQHGESLRPSTPPSVHDRAPDRRLRVGYVSPDLRDHPVARHLLPVLRAHDPAQVEVVCYSDAFPADTTTARLRECVSLWRDTASWSDDRLAAQVRDDRIDLLVDLALHTAGNRLPVFARQPAPVQASFAGYPGATGLETIAWRVTDRFLDPPGTVAEPEFGQEFRLPDSFWLFDPLDDTPMVSELPAASAKGVVFGCLSRFSKVNDPVLHLWTELLRSLPEARLLLLCPEGAARSRVLAHFAAGGIGSSRIEFTGKLSRADYLTLYRRIDIALDPFPYNGHMTTCDALWMGVPVVSLAGETPVSRGGLSLLTNAGLPELVAFKAEEYLRIARELAGDLPHLAALRAGLRTRLQASPLMDAARFTRGLENAFRTMWREWCAG